MTGQSTHKPKEVKRGIASRDKIMAFINRYRAERGYPPSMDDICLGTGLTKTTVRHHLLRLEHDGKIERVRGIARGLRLKER